MARNLYQDALDVQGACNLSGVVRSLAEITEQLWAEARSQGKGTEYVNTHPVARLFAEQIVVLTGAGSTTCFSTYSEAYRICEERAKEGK